MVVEEQGHNEVMYEGRVLNLNVTLEILLEDDIMVEEQGENE